MIFKELLGLDLHQLELAGRKNYPLLVSTIAVIYSPDEIMPKGEVKVNNPIIELADQAPRQALEHVIDFPC